MWNVREDRLTAWLRRRARGAGGERQGDDAAFLPAGGPWAATVDTQIEGVHFPAGLDPRRVARRLLAVNLSDLAAVGAVPRYALLALAAPEGFDPRPFLAALVAECRRREVELVGGDLARSSRLTAVLTLLGGRPPRGRWVERSAARPGDGLWLGGTLGESAAGRRVLEAGGRTEGSRIDLPPALAGDRRLAAAARRALSRHLSPEPQLALGRWLGTRRRAAAIDVSDGLALDLHRLCGASGVGARVRRSDLPAPRLLEPLARRLGLDPLALVLAGGEDYVLLFALPPAVEPPARFECFRIGSITHERIVQIEGPEGLRPLAPEGWDHLAP